MDDEPLYSQVQTGTSAVVIAWIMMRTELRSDTNDRVCAPVSYPPARFSYTIHVPCEANPFLLARMRIMSEQARYERAGSSGQFALMYK